MKQNTINILGVRLFQSSRRGPNPTRPQIPCLSRFSGTRSNPRSFGLLGTHTQEPGGFLGLGVGPCVVGGLQYRRRPEFHLRVFRINYQFTF